MARLQEQRHLRSPTTPANVWAARPRRSARLPETLPTLTPMAARLGKLPFSCDSKSEMATIGQLTSHIANKQVRSEKYGQLKHKQKVCTVFAGPKRAL